MQMMSEGGPSMKGAVSLEGEEENREHVVRR